MPDHLTLPQYTDKFVAQNGAPFVTEMARDQHRGKNNLNDIKFLTGLRFGNDRQLRERKYEGDAKKEKAKKTYLKERNWDMGMLTRKKEPEKCYEESLRRYDSNFDKKIIAALDRKTK